MIKYALRLIKLGNRFARRIPVLPEDRREGAPRRTVMPTRGTVSARAMLAAMIDGTPIPCCWTILRGAGCVARFLELAQALTGHFDAHHAQLAKSILRRLGFCSPWLAFLESLWRREPDEWRRPALCLRATSTSVYVRLHGPDGAHLYAGSYGDADLYWSADRIRE